MRRSVLVTSIVVGLGISGLLASPAAPLTLDMWATPVHVQVSGPNGGPVPQVDPTISGPDAPFGNVSRTTSVSQKAGQVPTHVTSADTGVGNLVFQAIDSNGQLAIDYQFTNAVSSIGQIPLEVANLLSSSFRIALFIEKEAPVAGQAKWDYTGSTATIDGAPPSSLEEYMLDTNYFGDIYGILLVYNPRDDLRDSIPDPDGTGTSFFNTGFDGFPTVNEPSIHAELCCIMVPQPPTLVLVFLGIGLIAWKFRSRPRRGAGPC